MSENNIAIYKAKGLSEPEIQALVKYNEAGRPGVAKMKVDALQALYNVGFTCQEIHNQFPEYPYGAILLCRVQQDWDGKKDAYRKQMENDMLSTIKNARLESVKMVADMIQATNIHWKMQLMNYLANPEKEKAPDFLPKTMSQYGSLASLLKELTETDKNTKQDTPGSNGGGLPTIIINNNSSGLKTDVEVQHTQRVKEALARQVAAKKNGQ